MEKPNSDIAPVFADLQGKREQIIKENKLDRKKGYQKRGIHSNELNEIISMTKIKHVNIPT